MDYIQHNTSLDKKLFSTINKVKITLQESETNGLKKNL
jgi:hypothetical protein